jgi:hypothetical protein
MRRPTPIGARGGAECGRSGACAARYAAARVVRLPDDDLRAFAQAAAQTLGNLTARLRRDDLAKQGVAPIVAAADGLPINVLVAWAQDAPPEVLARAVIVAAPLRAVVEERLMPPDAPPTPQRSIARRRGQGRG